MFLYVVMEHTVVPLVNKQAAGIVYAGYPLIPWCGFLPVEGLQQKLLVKDPLVQFVNDCVLTDLSFFISVLVMFFSFFVSVYVYYFQSLS